MGNCLHIPQDRRAKYDNLCEPNKLKICNSSVPNLSEDDSLMHLDNADAGVGFATAGQESGDMGRGATINAHNDKGSNARPNLSQYTGRGGFSAVSADASGPRCDKNNPAWMKYVSSSRPRGDNNYENDTASSFGENWDPALFDQRGSPPLLKPFRYGDDKKKNLKMAENRMCEGKPANGYNLDHWSEEATMSRPTGKRERLPLVSSTILGFSHLRPDMFDNMEWYRNGELESSKPNTNNYLIKGKQPPVKQRDELNKNNVDREKLAQTQTSEQKDPSCHEGWLRYTMFLHQDRVDAAAFYSQFRKAKHRFLSLEAKTGCEIRFSGRLFIHRGKYVRTVVIDGPSRRHILRCYSSLPDLLTGPMILGCEHPSVSEPRPYPEGHGFTGFSENFPALLQKPLVA
ncbi:unnamed protein product [Calicophoron daubneyi]|uniref:Uncharacterized protein n=1 Tax=Calicophoron daubneyi TaxID=300641 RepID=A0AAV2T923_CALDB